MSYEEELTDKVQFEIIDQVAWITINNPDKGNAMSPGMRDRMTGLFESLSGLFDAVLIFPWGASTLRDLMMRQH